MSWLYDKKPKDKNKKDPNEWGFLCGFCGNTFHGDHIQLDEHQLKIPNETIEQTLERKRKSGDHRMCKGSNDTFNEAKYLVQGMTT